MKLLTHCWNCNKKLFKNDNAFCCNCFNKNCYSVWGKNNFRIYIKDLNLIIDKIDEDVEIQNVDNGKIILKISNIKLNLSKEKLIRQIKRLMKLKNFI